MSSTWKTSLSRTACDCETSVTGFSVPGWVIHLHITALQKAFSLGMTVLWGASEDSPGRQHPQLSKCYSALRFTHQLQISHVIFKYRTGIYLYDHFTDKFGSFWDLQFFSICIIIHLVPCGILKPLAKWERKLCLRLFGPSRLSEKTFTREMFSA